jgi:mannose-6-phosphate isomerase-like protein (cupin superfamily)
MNTNPQKGLNVPAAFARIGERWSPRIVAQVDDYHVKLVRIEGDFVWHSHADADELFWIIDGDLDIEMRDRTVHLRTGDIFVVPRGVEHRPVARAECRIALFERAGLLNTGDDSDGTPGEWL